MSRDEHELQAVEMFRSLAKIVTGEHTNYQEAYRLALKNNKTRGLFFAARLFMGFTNLRSYKDVFEVPIGMDISLDNVIPEILGLPTPFRPLPPLPLAPPGVFPPTGDIPPLPPGGDVPPPSGDTPPGVVSKPLVATRFAPPVQPESIDSDSLAKLWVLTTRTGFFTQDWTLGARTSVVFRDTFTTLKDKYGTKFTWLNSAEIIESGNWNAILLFVQIAAFKSSMMRYVTRSRGLKRPTFQRLKKRMGVCVVQFGPYVRREDSPETGGLTEYIAPKSAQSISTPNRASDVDNFLRNVLPPLIRDNTPAEETSSIFNELKKLYSDHKPSIDLNENYNSALDENMKDPVFMTGRMFQGFANLYHMEDVFESPDGMNYRIREDELLGPSRAIHLWVLCSRIGFFSKTFILKPSVEAHLMWAFFMLDLPSNKWKTYLDLVYDNPESNEARHMLFVKLAAMLYQLTTIFVRDDRTLKVYEDLLKEIKNIVNAFHRLY